MHYPHIDPVIIGYGPVAIRWYGLAYLAAFVDGVVARQQTRAHACTPDWTAQQVSDVVFYGALGAVLGGRIGYVFFYGFKQFLADPVWLFRIWDGGMSFHGGLLGVMVALCAVRTFDASHLSAGQRLRGAVGAAGSRFRPAR